MRFKPTLYLTRILFLIVGLTGFYVGILLSDDDAILVADNHQQQHPTECMHEEIGKTSKPWNLEEEYQSISSTCLKVETISNSLMRLFCKVEGEDFVYHIGRNSKPKVLLIDTSRDINNPSQSLKYYSSRDAQAWMLAYKDIGFEAILEHFPTKSSATQHHHQVRSSGTWDVLLCLGLRRQDEVCLHPSTHIQLRQRQRINQLNGIRNILWNKASFCETIKKVIQGFDHILPYFLPCFILPQDTNFAIAAMKSWVDRQWIMKPTDRGEGRGISILSTTDELLNRPSDQAIVQPFVDNPFLIDGYKFDLRCYVLVTSISPLRVYFYNEGLVRFAATKYHANKGSGKKGQDQYLTNTSVGKHLRKLSDLTWPFQKLRKWLTNNGYDCQQIFNEIHKAVVSTLMVSEPIFHDHFQSSMSMDQCQNCFQLLGVDIMLRDNLSPFVIEVNGLPSMQLTDNQGEDYNPSNVYTKTKLSMTHDLVTLLFKPTSTAEIATNILKQTNIGVSPGQNCNQEHEHCIHKSLVFHILRFVREYQNRGGFTLLYPSTTFDDVMKQLLKHTNDEILHDIYDHDTMRMPWFTTTYNLHPIMTKVLKALEQSANDN